MCCLRLGLICGVKNHLLAIVYSYGCFIKVLKSIVGLHNYTVRKDD